MKKLFPLYLNIFVAFLGVSMSVVIFTSFVLNEAESPLSHLSFSQRQYLFGLLISIYPAGQFLGSPVIGALSDRFGRRPTLLYSVLFSFLSYAATAIFLQQKEMLFLMLSLFIAGMFESNVVLAQGAIADICQDAKLRAARFGYISVTGSSAFIFGPLIAGFFLRFQLGPIDKFSAPYCFVSLLLLLILLWLYFAFEETHPEDKRAPVSFKQALTNLSNVVHDKRLRLYYLLNFFTYCAIFGFFRLFPVYVNNYFQASSTTISLLLAYVALPIILVNTLLFKRLLHHFSLKRLYSISLFLLALGNATIVFFSSFYFLWGTLLFTGFWVAVCATCAMISISHLANEKEQGQVMGNNGSVGLVPQFLQGSIGAFLALYSFKAPLIACAFCALIAAVLAKTLSFQKK